MNDILEKRVDFKGVADNTFKEVLTEEALEFLSSLHKKFNKKRIELLKKRDLVQKRFDKGVFPNFPNETITIRESDWVAAPLFSIDEEEDKGFPENVQKFNDLLNQYDGFIVSLAEHNGSYAAAFKNIFDWVSRIEREIFRDKPLLLMATSPGGRGGASVLEAANSTFPHLGGNIVATFSLPNFYDNFKDEIIDEDLRIILNKAIITFEKNI